MTKLRKVIVRLLGLKPRNLKPGTYKATLEGVSLNPEGTATIILSSVKSAKSRRQSK